MSVFDEVRQILISELAVKAEMVRPESKLSADLGADSMDGLELITVLEETFAIEINDEEASKISVVADIVELISRKRGVKILDQG